MPLSRSASLFCLLLVLSFGLTACAKAPRGTLTPPGVVQDTGQFPQDLQVYAKAGGDSVNLLTPAEQAEQDARFNRIFFGPWNMSKATLSARRFGKTFGKARGYDGVQPWTAARWNAMIQNANVKRYPSRKSPAIVTRHTSLRELPTASPRYAKPTPDPKADPFDYFQYSSLALGTPLFVTHMTRDKQWYFVENPIAAGWVAAADVALVDGNFISRYQNNRYAALIRDRVPLTSERGEALGQVHIGAVLPVAQTLGDNLLVMVPQRNTRGLAEITRALLVDGQAVIKPLPALPKLMAVIGNEMLGQPYGWGGLDENRDCSSTLRDFYTPFGIWLPRNSGAQAKAGRFSPLEGLDPQSKERAVLSSGTPFMSMLWMQGHIGLYLGKHKGRAAFFHNMWGVRVQEGPGEDNRHVIGRCVITSLEPGKELPNAIPEGSILNRIRGMSTLPGAVRP